MEPMIIVCHEGFVLFIALISFICSALLTSAEYEEVYDRHGQFLFAKLKLPNQQNISVKVKL